MSATGFPRLKIGEEGVYHGRKIVRRTNLAYELFRADGERPWIKLTRKELIDFMNRIESK